MSDETQRACSHLRVEWTTTATEQGMSGWWRCDACLAPFTLKPAVMARCEVCKRDCGHHDTVPHVDQSPVGQRGAWRSFATG